MSRRVGPFRRLHGLSQVLNLAQFLALFITLFGMVNH